MLFSSLPFTSLCQCCIWEALSFQSLFSYCRQAELIEILIFF